MHSVLRPMLTSLRGWAPAAAPPCWPSQMLPYRLLQACSALACSGGNNMHAPAHGLPIVYHEAYSAPQLPPGHRFPMVRAAAVDSLLHWCITTIDMDHQLACMPTMVMPGMRATCQQRIRAGLTSLCAVTGGIQEDLRGTAGGLHHEPEPGTAPRFLDGPWTSTLLTDASQMMHACMHPAGASSAAAGAQARQLARRCHPAAGANLEPRRSSRKLVLKKVVLEKGALQS